MFVNTLKVEALDEPGKWCLLEALLWRTEEGTVVVPAGFVTDLASIPAPMRGVLNTNGRSRRPAVAHDWMYAVGYKSRKFADRLFLEMLVAEKVLNVGRVLYFAGVRAGGWMPWRRYRSADAARARLAGPES